MPQFSRLSAVLSAALAALSLLALCLPAPAAQRDGTVVPRGTAPGQTLVWNAAGWTIAPIVYNGNNLTLPPGYTLGVGGQSNGSALYVAPNGAAQNGLKISVPAGGTGFPVSVSNSAQANAFAVEASGIISFPGSDSNNNPGFHFNAPGKTTNFGGNLGLGLTSDFTMTAIVASYMRGGWDIKNPDGITVARTDANGNTSSLLSLTSPIINATTKFQAGGTDGYTGNIPASAQSTHVKGGIIVGFTDSNGSTVGQ